MVYKKKKKRVMKKNVKYSIIGVAAILGIGLVAILGKHTMSGNKGDELISKEILNSNDPTIITLEEESNEYPKVKKILNNIDLYPKDLLDLAAKKPETIDFVSDYIYNDSKINKKISVKDDYKKGEIPLFLQWDERWGYDKYGSNFIAIDGCGPTSLAMVAVGLTGNTNINPKVVSDFAYDRGYYVEGIGSKWSLMTDGVSNFGLKGKEIPLSKEVIISTLKKGEPIIATMGPGTFTTQGHYIVLTGVDKDGNIIVNDPDSKEKSNKTWDIDIFMKETKDLWKFSVA
ncbi:C39 family peptidase [Romboutsia sp. 1001216sp1]|uniref:C39 family peptidase n=1 Tax=unclassified Romboutsia TaxID=2626894 RepID=UPI0018A8C395|nr:MULTISPECIES: C39 family peptidase [unclassified Romboutsia]MDB8793977.1 C39 family peptidase [Romboutsia sp. 1001216sp1]MDB8796904.1 C39 family peptidase [Romboutsia sp. 1001216sp1]MDB8800118.1 C39 family peptidase [Romboutsia sp. 1001216sp1]